MSIEEKLSKSILYNLNILRHAVPCSNQVKDALVEVRNEEIVNYDLVWLKNQKIFLGNFHKIIYKRFCAYNAIFIHNHRLKRV
jgi:hypothetical protein